MHRAHTYLHSALPQRLLPLAGAFGQPMRSTLPQQPAVNTSSSTAGGFQSSGLCDFAHAPFTHIRAPWRASNAQLATVGCEAWGCRRGCPCCAVRSVRTCQGKPVPHVRQARVAAAVWLHLHTRLGCRVARICLPTCNANALPSCARCILLLLPGHATHPAYRYVRPVSSLLHCTPVAPHH